MALTNTSPERGILPQTTRECHPRRSEDSWIELSSQPSSSSLSSAATTDDIITTGLRVQQLRRRRATHHHHHNHNHRVGYHVPPQDLEIGYSHRSSSTTGSSQDENEETESESDRLSNDDFPTRLQPDMNLLPEISSHFSAGYVLGREVGRVESGQALYGNGLSNVSEPATSSFATLKSGAGCGREAIRGGLGRFRWTGGSVSA
ncbi:hypothetical protein TESG_03607 [Trichophyton tonsurans CBS 112818]|uniref:Uncharacterized protein n=1 Tax=Trichophyton tonsurans (strain CBS 112818) TaxID=647933 RepID=F2RXV5_TRIT1|nr:hypothetical protein TESG_03607 [Trichophyton tonsurans CBS 112818]